MQKEKVALIVLVIMVMAALLTFLVASQTNVFDDLFKEKLTIREGDCADVHYIGRYASNNTVFDSSYRYVENKTGGTPLKVFVTLNPNATSPITGYSSQLIKGFMQGLIGVQEGQTKTIGPIPPEDAYGDNKLKIGDTFQSEFFTYSDNDRQFTQTLRLMNWTEEFMTFQWIDIDLPENFTMPEGIILEDVEQNPYFPWENIPYFIWENSSQVINITDEIVYIRTTPTKATNITDEITFFGVNDMMTFIYPNATEAIWNESSITIRGSPEVGVSYLLNYSGTFITVLIENVTEEHINVTISMEGQPAQSFLTNRTITFDRVYEMRRVYQLPTDFVPFYIQDELEDAGYNLHELAGESLLFEVTVVKVYRIS